MEVDVPLSPHAQVEVTRLHCARIVPGRLVTIAVTDSKLETRKSNLDGRYADFHSLRHLFITWLSQAGISPKMAQTLARHSDIRLTLNVYTHVELADQTAAMQALPGPPVAMATGRVERLRVSG
jgi:integrase